MTTVGGQVVIRSGSTRALQVGREPSGVVWVEVGPSQSSPPVRIRLSPDVAYQMCNALFDVMGLKCLVVPKGKVMPLKADRRADEPIAEEK